MSEACAAILREIGTLSSEEIPLRAALGRVLAEEVRSPLSLPPWDNASMDGYAVRAEDIGSAATASPVTLKVIGTVAAGAAAGRGVRRGEAFRIMTGAPVPPGADSVVRVEDTDGGETTVRIHSARDANRNVRRRGEDLGADAVAAAAGELLYPGHLGLLASVGRAAVSVVRRPRVALLASGDELVDVDRFDDVLAGKRIVTSNTYSLFAAVVEAGGEPVSLGVVPDDPVALRERIAAATCDLLVTTGGVSVGAFDHTRDVVTELGGAASLRFWRVRIRPGAPLSFGVVRGTPWLGLPGNPVSALVTFELFGRPAIRRMLGHTQLFRATVPVRIDEAIALAAPLTHFFRAIVRRAEGATGYVARLTGPQGSGLLSSMARANALLIVPPERQRVEAGEMLQAILQREDVGHAAVPPAA